MPPKSRKTLPQSNISAWLKQETPEKRKALETASKHFNKKDSFDVHTLEAVYAKESSFGQLRGEPNSLQAAGDFQIKKGTATSLGLEVSESNDERFNFDKASAAAAKQLKISDSHFAKETVLIGETKTQAVMDLDERKKFSLAAYNAGDKRIAVAQKLAGDAGDDPTKWKDVQKYLVQAGATKSQTKETQDYVEKVVGFEREFAKKSKAKAKAKFEKIKQIPLGAHWITIDGRHILIKG